MAKYILRSSTKLVIGLVILVLSLFAALIVVGRSQGYELLSVQSDSMAPMLRKGDAVVVQRSSSNPKIDIRVGDVVSYASPTNNQVIVTHRVVVVDGERGTVVARGDNAPVTDLPIAQQSIIGKVLVGLPFLGYGLDALKHPAGLAALVYIPALGIVASEIRRLKQHYSGVSPDRYILHGFLPSK